MKLYMGVLAAYFVALAKRENLDFDIVVHLSTDARDGTTVMFDVFESECKNCKHCDVQEKLDELSSVRL